MHSSFEKKNNCCSDSITYQKLEREKGMLNDISWQVGEVNI